MFGSNTNVLRKTLGKLQFSFLQTFSLRTLSIKTSLVVFAEMLEKAQLWD